MTNRLKKLELENMINPKVTSFIFFTASLIALSSCSSIGVETENNFEVVELPDGSIAFLNYNSAVSYDKEFRARTLEVQGEVFLSVVESEIPFCCKIAAWRNNSSGDRVQREGAGRGVGG